ncbi:hypothetical protein H3S95_08005, partial [Bartonella sp. M0193]
QAPSRTPGLTLSPDEVIPATIEQMPVKSKKTAGTDHGNTTKTDSTSTMIKDREDNSKATQIFHTKPVVVVDAVDPSKPDIPVDVTRINVDDPGVRKK